MWEWDNLAVLDILERKRGQRRASHSRLTFDCFKAKVNDDRVYCAAGHHLGTAQDGTTALITVLKGTTSSICLLCPDFEGE